MVHLAAPNRNVAVLAFEAVSLPNPVVTLKACRTAKALIWTAIIGLTPVCTLGFIFNLTLGGAVWTTPLHTYGLPLRMLVAITHDYP
jgi:hypothetical protein